MFDFSQLNSIMGGFNGAPNDPSGLLQLQQGNQPAGQGMMTSPYANTQGFQGLLQPQNPYQPYGQTQSPYTQMDPFNGQMIQDYLAPFMQQRQEMQDSPGQQVGPAAPSTPVPGPAPVQEQQFYLGTDMFGSPSWGNANDYMRMNQFTEGGG